MTRTLKSTALLATLLTPMLVGVSACDSDGSDDADERVADAELDDELDEASPASDGFHETRRQVMLGFACEELECSDDQRDKLGDLMDSVHELKKPSPNKTEAREEANQRFADAFRGKDFGEDDVAALRTHMEGEFDHVKTEMIGAAVELHGILEADQRDKVADLLEMGPRGFKSMHAEGDRDDVRGFRHKMHGKRRGHGHANWRDMDPETRHAKMAEKGAEHLCEKIECEGDQQERLAQAMKDNAPKMGEADKAKFDEFRTAMADTFRGDRLDAKALETKLAAFEPALRQKMGQLENLPLEIHDILTPEQRGIVADELIAKGPMMFGPHHGRRAQ